MKTCKKCGKPMRNCMCAIDFNLEEVLKEYKQEKKAGHVSKDVSEVDIKEKYISISDDDALHNPHRVIEIFDLFKDENIKSLTVQKTGKETILIRGEGIDEDKNNQIKEKLKSSIGEFTEERFETVGPTVSSDLRRKAFIAVGIASLAIIIYLAIAFRKVPKPANSWRFGITAVVAVLHDLLIVVGLFSVLGHFFPNIVVDSLFITALLTVLGFSVHDTIVVFDRLRENLRRLALSDDNFSAIANESIKQTIARSINTSLTVIIALLAVLLFGGETIFPFVLALLVGIVVGTYSSVFVATALLVDWTEISIRRSEAK